MQTIKNIIFLCLLLLFLLVSCGMPVEENTGSVTVRLSKEPESLNYFFASSSYAEQVFNYIFFSLQRYDPVDLKLKPLLIKEGPEIKQLATGKYKGGASYTFELLEEAKWSDGHPVLASDYLFTHKIIWNPKVSAPHRHWLDLVQDIRIDPNNPRRFTIYTNKVYFLAEEMLSIIPPLPAHLYDPTGLMDSFSLVSLRELTTPDSLNRLPGFEKLEEFAKAFKSEKFSHDPEGIIGSGAYKLVHWEKGQSISLRKKVNWWGDQLSQQNDLLKAIPSAIEYKIIKDNTAAITVMKDGGLDVVTGVEPEAFRDLQQNDFVTQKFNLTTPPYLSYTYLGLNSKQAPLNDKKVRRAIAHCLDIDKAIETVIYNMGERVHSPIHPTKAAYHRKLKPIPYDINKAVKQLNDAGWTDSDGNGVLDKKINGKLIELRLKINYTASNLVAANMLALFKEDAAQAGIVFELEPLEFRSLIKQYKARNYDLVMGQWAQLPGADDFHQIWHTDGDTPGGFNRTGFGNAASDAIIDSIGITLDTETRNQLYLSIQERIYDEQTYIFLYAPRERIAISKKYKARTSALRPGFFVNQFELK